MTKRVFAGAVAALVFSGGVVFAQAKDKKTPAGKGDAGGGQAGAPAVKEAPPPAEMKPPEISEQLKAATKELTGTWRCKGKVAAMPGSPEHEVDATFKWKKDADGFWMTGVYEEKKTKVNPKPFKMTVHRSYDAAKSRWVEVAIDNMGGVGMSYTTSADDTTKKWEGKSEMAGMQMWGRGTETKVSAREITMTGEMSMDGKTWTPMYEATCKK